MELKEVKFRNAKPKEKPYRLNDGGGLSLLINPNGSKWWRFRYTFNGKENGLSFGVYPDVTLESARKKRAAARQSVADGIDPAAERKEKKADKANTFKHVASEWYGKNAHTWVPNYADKVRRTLENDLYLLLGDKSVNKIIQADVLAALRKIESRGVEAQRACRLCAQIFRYAIASGMATVDPSFALKDVLRKRQGTHYPAITEPKNVAILLRAIDTYPGTFVVKQALKLLPLVFVRPGELRHAEWSEIDFEAAIWAIPAEKMKMRVAHIVPLSRQAVEILKSLYDVTGDGKHVFPSMRTDNRPMSDNATFVALNTLGYAGTHTAHGFRATARTILDEVLHFQHHLIECQLAHAVKDANGTAYNRTSHLEERRKMMQVWADYLEGLKAGARVIPFKRAA